MSAGVELAVLHVQLALRCTLRSAPTQNVDAILARARHSLESELRDALPYVIEARPTVWSAVVRG